jgi:glycosyltransferase involved in cell wall biosynthesis
LAEFQPGLEVAFQRSFWPDLRPSLHYALGVMTRFNIPRILGSNLVSSVSAADIDKHHPDVIFSYFQYPKQKCRIPFVFTTGTTERDYLRSLGVSESEIEREIDLKREGFAAAAAVFANSRTAAKSLREMAPESAHKIKYLPLFLPDLPGCDEASIQQRQNGLERWELLFVGRMARRKGLPELIQALNICAKKGLHPFRLTVVSAMADGAVDLTASFPIVHLKETSHHLVLELMKKSHLFVMPSHFEGFAWVYLEALANGAIPLAGDRAAEREALGNGEYGILIKVNPLEISERISPILADPGSYSERADRGRKHWVDSYSPAAVAQMFYGELSPIVHPSPVTETMPLTQLATM